MSKIDHSRTEAINQSIRIWPHKKTLSKEQLMELPKPTSLTEMRPTPGWGHYLKELTSDAGRREWSFLTPRPKPLGESISRQKCPFLQRGNVLSSTCGPRFLPILSGKKNRLLVRPEEYESLHILLGVYFINSPEPGKIRPERNKWGLDVGQCSLPKWVCFMVIMSRISTLAGIDCRSLHYPSVSRGFLRKWFICLNKVRQ